jgi:N-acetyl-alpha-D-glucosaminyl L-malate synthase BshA
VSAQGLRIGITCYPTFGGSGIVATEIGVALARRGYQVHFICSRLPSRLGELRENVELHEVASPSYPLFDSPYALALASKMVEVSRSASLDVLHVHYAIPHATSAFLATQILGKDAPRVITTLHGTDITLVGSDPSFLPITRFSISRSDGVTVPSRALRESTYALLGVERSKPIEVIPNFVDTELFTPDPHRSTEGRRPFVLVHNSNFRPVKRVEDVVRVFAAVKRELPCTLVLIGDGPDRPRMEERVRQLGLEGSVRFLGEQLTFIEHLQRADVFLLPSELESFGLAALEALSCGVPVVASRIGGLPEVVSDGETGFLHPVGDIEAMAQSVLRLLRDPALHSRMSRAARASAEASWPIEPIVARYETYYRQVLEAAPK